MEESEFERNVPHFGFGSLWQAKYVHIMRKTQKYQFINILFCRFSNNTHIADLKPAVYFRSNN
jgi:hypothetical protein